MEGKIEARKLEQKDFYVGLWMADKFPKMLKPWAEGLVQSYAEKNIYLDSAQLVREFSDGQVTGIM